MGQHDAIVRGVRRFSSVLQAYEGGITPSQVKEQVTSILAPEFSNPERLARYGIDLLLGEAVNVSKIRAHEWASNLYNKCIQLRREALRKNQKNCGEICSQWLSLTTEALSIYWSSVRLEQKKTDFALNDFAHEMFRNLGSMLEGVFQTYLKELLHVGCSQQAPLTQFEDIRSLSFGAAIKQFETKTNIFLSIPKQTIPVNQWRNIAQHYSLKIKGEKIHCNYGSKNQYSVEFSRQELLEAARDLFLLFGVLRTSHSIFFS